jgi:hypothetical protein
MHDIDTLAQLLAQLTPEQRQKIVPKLIWAVERYTAFENRSLPDKGSISRSFTFGFSRSSVRTPARPMPE